MEIRNRKNIIIIHIFCVLVLSVLLSGCVERIHLKETAKTSREKRTLEFVDGTWNGDFLEKAKQLLQKRLMESGEGHYNVVIEDFDSDNSSANVMIIKNDKMMWTCEILCQMQMDDGSVLENVMYDRRWSGPFKITDKTIIREIAQRTNHSVYQFSIEIKEEQDSARKRVTCIDDAIRAYQNAKNRERWKEIMEQKADYSALQQVSACDEFQVQIYSFQTQKNVQYYFVDDTTQTYVRVDYDKENAVYTSFFEKGKLEKGKGLEKCKKAEYLGQRTITVSPLYVPLFLEEDWPWQLMMDIKEEVTSTLKEEQGQGEYILYIAGFSEADEKTDLLIQNKATNQLYNNSVNFILSGQKRKVNIEDGGLSPIKNIDCGGINYLDAFAKTSICKVSIKI